MSYQKKLLLPVLVLLHPDRILSKRIFILDYQNNTNAAFKPLLGRSSAYQPPEPSPGQNSPSPASWSGTTRTKPGSWHAWSGDSYPVIFPRLNTWLKILYDSALDTWMRPHMAQSKWASQNPQLNISLLELGAVRKTIVIILKRFKR